LAPGQPHLSKKIEEKLNTLLSNEEGIRPSKLRKDLQNVMWDDVGVFRSRDSLERAAREFDRLKALLPQQRVCLKSRHNNKELIEALENEFLLDVAECTLTAASMRTESRGAHFREDYPAIDNKNWLDHILLNKDGVELKISKCPVDLSEIRPKES
jgi:succinate dehydrogenase / fumarate reductase flavoprotein subunit